MNKVKINFPNEVFVDGDQVILHIDRFQELLESERENATLRNQTKTLTKRRNKNMDKEKLKFYSIGRGSLNLNGKFYYGLDYAITDFMMDLEQQCKKQKGVIDDCKEDISHLLNIINENCYELKCTSDEWLVIQKYQDKDVSECNK